MKSARLISLLEKYKEGILPIDTTTIELIKEINELYKQVEVLQMQVNGLRADRWASPPFEPISPLGIPGGKGVPYTGTGSPSTVKYPRYDKDNMPI